VVRRGDTYGYQLTQELGEVVGLSESTLYPVLRRLMKEGALSCYDQPVDGRNRRYYRITPAGEAQYRAYIEAWLAHKMAIDNILLEESHG
jgi:PadR family transcriptional regulator PadR